MIDCPLLDKCRKVSGIDCTGRDFRYCDLLQVLIAENILFNNKVTDWYLYSPWVKDTLSAYLYGCICSKYLQQ